MDLKPRMVVLLVDALGWRLAESTGGFAKGLEHRRRLDTVLGFSSGALPTLFTGRLPDGHGRFMMYRRAAGDTPFAGFQWLRWLPARIRTSYRFGQMLRRFVESRGVNGYFQLYDVPRDLLSEFDLPERRDIFAPGGLAGGSLWDTLEARGVAWAGRNWRTGESANLRWLLERVQQGDESVLFCYTADLDALLHREGSEGRGVAERLVRYNGLLARLEAAAMERGERLWLYVLSDHGMVDVTDTVDLMKIPDALGLVNGRDHLAFYDSTMARFWWRAPGVRERVMDAVASTGSGKWLDADALRREGVHFDRHEFGEDIFLLKPGVLMLPSFMGRARLAAMHGYDPSHPDMAALLLSNRPVPDDVTHIRDVRRHLESELEALGRLA